MFYINPEVNGCTIFYNGKMTRVYGDAIGGVGDFIRVFQHMNPVVFVNVVGVGKIWYDQLKYNGVNVQPVSKTDLNGLQDA